MAARFVKSLYVRLDLPDGQGRVPRPSPAPNRDAITPRVLPDHKKGTEQRARAPLPPRAEPSDDGAIRVLRDDKAGTDEYARAPLPPQTKTSEDSSIKVLRDDQAGTDEYARAPVPPRTDHQDDGAAKILRNDKIVIEDLEREEQLRPAKPRIRRVDPDDEYISNRTIIVITGAVIAVAFTFTALLPSILTRDPVESTVTLTTSPAAAQPAQPAQTAQSGATQPVPDSRPIQPPPAAATAPASDDATPVAKTAPALRGTNAADAQADGRATGRALAPNAGTAAGRLALTAEEQAAVTRGLQALEKRAAVNTPPRPASTRPALTAEEKAAVERGLRELEKTAGQAKP